MITQAAAVRILVHYVRVALGKSSVTITGDMELELESACEAFGPPPTVVLREKTILAVMRAIDPSVEGVARRCTEKAVAAIRALPMGTFMDERS